MIRPVNDPAIVNHFANHPDILPHIAGGRDSLDLTAGVTDPNVFLFGEHGGFCWIWSAPETFEGHVMLTRAGRGAWGARLIRGAVQYMADHGATHLWARIHPERPEVGIYAAQGGLRDTGTTHSADMGEGPVAWRIFNWRA